jgi:hypothetical protein
MLCSYKETTNFKTGRTFVDQKFVGLHINFSDELGEEEIIKVCAKLGVVPAQCEDNAAINVDEDKSGKVTGYFVGWGQDGDGDWPGCGVTFKVNESGAGS